MERQMQRGALRAVLCGVWGPAVGTPGLCRCLLSLPTAVMLGCSAQEKEASQDPRARFSVSPCIFFAATVLK